MSKPFLTFIGAGNMASAMIGGLTAQGYPAELILASDPFEESRQRLVEATGVAVTDDNVSAVNKADVVILAVKPQVMSAVLEPLVEAFQASRPLVISIAAGIEVDSLDRWTGGGLPVIRCMPNTPALVQLGATALFANGQVSGEQKQLADEIMASIGLGVWVEKESELDAVTALSGSGPAYFFLVIEAMQAAGIELGLPEKVANQLTLQTALGAATMAINSDVDAAELRRRVTSPNGTTEQAINSLEASGLRESFRKALTAARDRSMALAREMDS